LKHLKKSKVSWNVINSKCKGLKMLPLTLEDEAELKCFGQNAKEQFEGRQFWISAARLEKYNSSVNKWCLPNSKELLFANSTNLRDEDKFEFNPASSADR